MIKKVQAAAERLGLAKKEFSELPFGGKLSDEMGVGLTLLDGTIHVTVYRHTVDGKKLDQAQVAQIPQPEARELLKYLTELFSEE